MLFLLSMSCKDKLSLSLSLSLNSINCGIRINHVQEEAEIRWEKKKHPAIVYRKCLVEFLFLKKDKYINMFGWIFVAFINVEFPHSR